VAVDAPVDVACHGGFFLWGGGAVEALEKLVRHGGCGAGEAELLADFQDEDTAWMILREVLFEVVGDERIELPAEAGFD
jgi:hypothetical protein